MKYKTIIDGVNVSECKHYTGNVDYLSNKDWTCRAEMINTRCEDCPNCDFKQLKRAEQECEELKTIINKSAEKFANDYLETFEENQKLKDDLQNIQHNCTREGCRYYEDNTYKVFYKCKAKTELSKCQQALDEIEYQAKELFLGVEDKDRPYCEKILDIINKAKESYV